MKKIYSLITVGLMIATAIFSMTTVSAEWEPSPPYQPMPMIKNVNKDDWHGRPTVPGDKNIYFTATVDYMEGPFHWIYEFTFVEGQLGAPDNPIFVESDNDLEYNRMNPTWFFTYGFNFVSTYTVKIKVYNDTGKQASWPQLIPADNYTYIDLNVNANSEDRNYVGISNCTYDWLNLPDGFYPEKYGVPVRLKGSGEIDDLYQYSGFTEEISWKFEGGPYLDGDWECEKMHDVNMTGDDDALFDITLKYKVIWGDEERNEYWEDENTIENDVLIYSNWFWMELDVYHWRYGDTFLHNQPAWFRGTYYVYPSITEPQGIPTFRKTPEVKVNISVFINVNPPFAQEDEKLIDSTIDELGRRNPSQNYQWCQGNFNIETYWCEHTGHCQLRGTVYFLDTYPEYKDLLWQDEYYDFWVIVL